MQADDQTDSGPVYASLVVSAARRVASAVDKLTAALAVPAVPIASCSNCSTPLVDVGLAALRCIWCGQVQNADGSIVVAGERVTFELAELGRGELESSSDDAGSDVDVAIESMRDRYHLALEGDDL